MRYSVVMPTWNRAGIVQNAIRSIIDQTTPDWELIIVDDGSEDTTKYLVESFADSRIRYFKRPHTGNIAQLRNFGNQQAKGDIIVVQDSDDQSFPDRLKQIGFVFDSKEPDVVYHGMYLRFFDPYHNAIMRHVRPAQAFDLDRLLKEQYIPGQVAYRREVILKYPYEESMPLMDDYPMLLNLALNGCRFYALDRNLYDYVESPDSVNVAGEADGRRAKDVATLVAMLKEKHGIKARAEMFKKIIA